MSQCNRVTQQPPDDGLSSTSKSSPMYTGNRITPNKQMYTKKILTNGNKTNRRSKIYRKRNSY